MEKTNGDFIERLNKLLQPDERIFKVHNAVLDENALTVTLLVNSYDFDRALNADFQERVYNFAVRVLPEECPLLKLEFKKTITSEDIVLRAFLKYIYDEFNILSPKISKDLIKVNVVKDTIKITVRMPRYIYNYCENYNFTDKVSDYLEHEFMESVSCEVKLDDSLVEETFEPDIQYTKKALGLIEIKIKESILPGVISKAPVYIENAKKKAASDVVICGKVKSKVQREARNTKKIFFTFTLDDTTSTINVSVFPKNEAETEKLQNLSDNDCVVACGNISYNTYEYANSMIANKLSYCEIDFDKIKISMKYKDALAEYVTVRPEPYVDKEQTDLFELFSFPTEDKTEYVVFDFETTGLYINNGAEPIELGAVKIKDGVITEQFSTFIKTDKPLSQEIINLTGITDKDLADAPLMEQVIVDFYKFAKDAVLVGHNVSFDMAFLEKYAKLQGYAFANDCIDTVNLAKLKVKSKDYKLATLIEEFGINNLGAHRAIYDAIATAKLFLRLNSMADLV